MARKGRTEREGIREILTRPEAFIAAGIAYLALGTLAAMDPTIAAEGIPIETSLLSISVFLFGLLSFYAGIVTSKHALRMRYIPILIGIFLGIIASHNVLGLSPALSVAVTLFSLLSCYVLLFSRIRFEWLFCGGMLLLWLNFALGGLPILDMSIHNDLTRIVNPMFAAGFLFSTYALVRMHPMRRYLWLLLLATLAASTFRLYVGIAFVAWALMEIRQKDGSRKDMLKAAGLLTCGAAVFLSFIWIGHLLMAGNHTGWGLSPMQTLEHRLAFTTSVFDDIVHLSFPWGYTFGGSLSMESTEYTCRLLYGYDDRITSTTFGEAMLNFGLIGVLLTGWAAGAVLGNLHRRDYALYALLLATLISTLDVGINVFIVIEFIFLGWLRLVDEWR